MSAGSVFLQGVLAAAAIAGIGFTQVACEAAESLVRQPDVGRGTVIAAQGVGVGVPACAQCHAFNGSSDGSGAFPRIAGQPAYYLAKQMRDFASDTRANAVMGPIAKALSPQDIADVTAYYASVSAPFLPLKTPDPTLVRRGEQLATIGDETKQLPSCNNCHGPGGVGQPPAIPYLAGQYAHYTAFELKMWQRGFRKNSAETMAEIARKLDDRDVAAVAAYFQQVRALPQTPTQAKE